MLTAGRTFDLPFILRGGFSLLGAHSSTRLLARLPPRSPAGGALLWVLLAPEKDVAGGDG